MKKLSSLSIFFPCYNDGKIISYLILKAANVANKLADKYEVIVINDGSQDDSYTILENLKAYLPFLKVIHHEKNKGYGAALISGFKAAKNKWVFYTDGDGQYNPEELEFLVSKLQKNTDVVNGFKKDRNDAKIRRLLGSFYNKQVHKKYSLPISDIDCDFRLIKNSLLKKINLRSHSGNICVELITKLQKKGAIFEEVEVNHYPRVFGSSQFFTPSNLFKTAKEHFTYKVEK